MNTAPHGAAMRSFREPDELLEGFPGVRIRITPTGRDPFGVTLTSLRLGDVALQVGRSSPFIAFAEAVPGHAILQCPLDHVESLVLNGAQCQPGSFAAYGPGGALLRANPQPCLYSTLDFQAERVASMLELPEESPLFRPGSFAMRQAGPRVWQRVSTIIRAAAETAATGPDIFEAGEPRKALRDSLLRAARALVADSGGDGLKAPRSAAARRRIVVAADEYLRAHKDRAIYTDELCEALGTSPSALAEAFRAMFLTSPHRFLKLRRLSMVRSVLCGTEGEPLLVKTVAMSHGFWHLGQFAHDYRATFGETPSQTVARVHG